MKEEKKEVLRLDPDIDKGLSTDEVNERITTGNINKTNKKVGKSYAQIIKDNTLSVFNIVFFIIAIVFIVFMVLLHHFGFDKEARNYFGISKFVFLIPVILNMIIGIVQEIRCKKALEKMKLVTESHSLVIRNSKEETILSRNLVLDDIVRINAGEQAQADLIVKKGKMSVDESFLTGESDLVEKEVGDTIYQGSMIIVGGGYARCIHVGDETYTSKLQSNVKSIEQHKSELLTDINKIIHWLSILLCVIIVVCISTLCYKIMRWGNDGTIWGNANGEMTLSLDNPVTWGRIIVATSAFAVGVIPSGLVLMTSITLAISIIKLSKENTLIQELYSLENLSRVDTICLDKTGTLTDGTMRVVDVKYFKDNGEVTEHIRNLLGSQESINQTSKALIEKFDKNSNVHFKELIPFSSKIKSSGLIYQNGEKLLLGAPEYISKGVEEDYINEMTSKGYRILSLVLDNELLALYVLEDVIRPTAKSTIEFFYENHVDVRIISGDNIKTVSKISELCGVKDTNKAISLEGVALDELEEIVPNYTIFGRVSPEQKQKIIEVLQKSGRKVAMTGDGVNDILALRTANASITFEKATDAAKSCSDVILLDNDFSHLKEVVKQGRRVVNNITRSSVLFLMKTIAIALLSFFLIFTKKGQMWYSLENIYLLETAVIALGGLLLSLEMSHEPIKGKFRINVLSKALPSGLLILIAAILPVALNAIPKFFGFNPIVSNDNVGALISVLTVTAGLAVTASMCRPFNKYRLIVFITVLLFVIFLALAFPTSFIGGKPTSVQMISDGTFFKEFFKPWKAEAFLTFNNEKQCYLIFGIFMVVSIPLYFLLIRFVNKALLKYALKLDSKLEEQEKKLNIK